MSREKLKKKIVEKANEFADALPDNMMPEVAAVQVGGRFMLLADQWRADRIQEEHNARKDDPVQKAAERGFNS